MKTILNSFTVCLALLLMGVAINTTKAQVINTYAGNGTAGFSGDGSAATAAQLNGPWGIATDASGNLYIGDFPNYRIRKVDASTQIISTICGTGSWGFSGDGGPATAAAITEVTDIAVYGSNIYFVDIFNVRIRMIDGSGTITTIAGNGTVGHTGDGGPATAAAISVDNGIAVDNSGNVYITEQTTNCIRRIDASTGYIYTIAGTGVAGYSGDGAAATAAQLDLPNVPVVDGSGNLYFSDYNNNVVRRIDGSTGIITTFAGTGAVGYTGDGAAATAATLNGPGGVDVDASGNVYIGDSRNNVVRMVDPSGVISTFAGTGVAGYSGDGGAPSAAQLNYPDYLAHDGCGNKYISDMSNNVIRVIQPGYVIGGSHRVCVGSTTMLSYPVSGGTWSSSASGVASVGSGSGIVTGVSAGTATITYTTTCGYATFLMSVDPLPTISGNLSLCLQGSTVLSGTPTGGSFSSGSPNVNVLNTTPGTCQVTGLAVGIATITYTSPAGCTATVAVSVDAPANITGPHNVCVGATIGLSSSPAMYGTWSTTSTHASVGSTTGIVTGISAGTAVITYTNACGMWFYQITVMARPGITGNRPLCVGTHITLTGTPVGGSWSGSNSVASVGVSSGIVTGLSGGTVTLTYTNLAGCTATVVVTINATPPITGSGTLCMDGTTTLSTSPATGGTWTSSDNTVATVGTSSGIVTGVAGGVVTITYTDGCGFSVYQMTVNWCCLANSLIINTGYDPVSGSAVTPVQT